MISAYEQGMSVEEIAENMEFETTAVKAALYQGSQLYRDRSKKDIDLKFNESEQEQAKRAIIRVMQSSDDDYLILRAAKYIRDDAEGRLDNPLKGLKTMNVNVIAFNEQLIRAREGKERSKGQLTDSTPQIENKADIEIETEVKAV